MPPVQLNDQMTAALASAIEDRVPVVVATAGARGMPDVAFKGSVMTWDEEHLAFWERAHGTTLRNLEENPQVALMYTNFTARVGWRFFGVAELLAEGPLREAIMAKTIDLELQRDPERKGVAVLIRVDRVMQGRDVIMEREPAPA